MYIVGSWSCDFTILCGPKDLSLEIYFYLKDLEGGIIEFRLTEIQDESNFCPAQHI